MGKYSADLPTSIVVVLSRILVISMNFENLFDNDEPLHSYLQVFVDHPSFHRPGNPYGDIYGAFGDNQACVILLKL